MTPAFVKKRPIVTTNDREAIDKALVELRRDTFGELDRLEQETTQKVLQFFYGERSGSETVRKLFSSPGGASQWVPGMPWFDESQERVAIARIRDDRSLFAAAFGLKPQCTTRRSSGVLSKREFLRWSDGVPYNKLKREAVNREWFDCPEGITDGARIESAGIRRSIENSLRFKTNADRARLDLSFQQLTMAARKAGDGAVSLAQQGLTLVDDEIDLGREKCRAGFMPISHCLANAAKAYGEERYSDAVGIMKREAIGETIDTTDSAVKTAEDKLVAARINMHTTASLGMNVLDRYAQKVFDFKDLFNVVMWLVLALAILKSYLYVLATEVFNKNQILNINVRSGWPAATGTYETTQKVEIGKDFGLRLLTKEVGDNQKQELALFPQPLSSIGARIRNGVYFGMNFGSHASGTEKMIFRANRDQQIVQWRMAEGEQVVFSYRDFLGISENVKLGSFISLSLSTLLLGRYIFHTATCVKGSGLLLLETTVDSRSDEIDYVPLDRIAAWNSHIQFHVNSNRSHRSVYVDGYIIGPTKDETGRSPGLILIRPEKTRRFGFNRLFRFIRTFLSPI